MAIRISTRRWTIICRRLIFQTYPLSRKDADEVARWCNEVYPDCSPHTVMARETRTWAEKMRRANDLRSGT
jgi:hypothetical protein